MGTTSTSQLSSRHNPFTTEVEKPFSELNIVRKSKSSSLTSTMFGPRGALLFQFSLLLLVGVRGDLPLLYRRSGESSFLEQLPLPQ